MAPKTKQKEQTIHITSRGMSKGRVETDIIDDVGDDDVGGAIG